MNNSENHSLDAIIVTLKEENRRLRAELSDVTKDIRLRDATHLLKRSRVRLTSAEPSLQYLLHCIDRWLDGKPSETYYTQSQIREFCKYLTTTVTVLEHTYTNFWRAWEDYIQHAAQDQDCEQ